MYRHQSPVSSQESRDYLLVSSQEVRRGDQAFEKYFLLFVAQGIVYTKGLGDKIIKYHVVMGA